MRILLDDASLDEAARQVSTVDSGLQSARARIKPSLAAGAPPAIQSQVAAAISEAERLVAEVQRGCPARASELRRRAILTRIANGEVRSSDLRALAAMQPGSGKARGGGGLFGLATINPRFNPFNILGQELSDAATNATDWLGRNGHGLLDGIGLLPVVGEPADVANGLLYGLEGNREMAALSLLGAMPVLGWGATGIKGVKRAADAGGGGGRVPKAGELAREAAERSAASAARRIQEWTPKNKHAYVEGATDRFSRFAAGVEPRGLVADALRHGRYRVEPNPSLENSQRCIVDAGRQIGTRGQTHIRVIIVDGRVVNAFPVHER